MRNLTCLSSVAAHLPVTAKTGSVQTASAVVFNPESSVIYTALETLASNGAVRIDLLAVEGYREDQIVEVNNRRNDRGRLIGLLANLICTLALASSPHTRPTRPRHLRPNSTPRRDAMSSASSFFQRPSLSVSSSPVETL
jgi:hypothetical protein